MTSQPTASSWVWPAVGATIAGLLTYLTSASGVALAGYLGALQVGFLVGVVVGLVSPSARVAFGAALVALVVGVLVLSPWFEQGQPMTLAVLVVTGVAIAGGVRFAVGSGQLRSSLVVGFAVAIAIGCMLLVVMSIVNLPDPTNHGLSVVQKISVRPVPGRNWDDSEFYRAVVWKMRDGQAYLAAFRSAYHENARWGVDPWSLFGVRFPLIFEYWKLLPSPWLQWALWSLLLLGSVAMAAAPFVVSKAVPPALGIVGATALAAYMLGYALVPTLLFLSEIWAGIIAVLVLAAFAQVRDEGDQRRWMILAAALALLAAMTRELMVFLLVAGVIASVFGPKHQRRFSTILWSGTLLAFFAYWGVSAFLARAIITPIPGGGFVWLAHGGLANLRSGIIASTWNIGGKWIPILLAVLGVAGAFAQPEKRYRIFAVAVVLMPLVGFLFAGSDAVGGGPARLPFNYWGGIVVPALFALAPASLAWIPGMRAPRVNPNSSGSGSPTPAPSAVT